MFNKILIVYKENQTKKHLATVERVKAMLQNKTLILVKTNELNESYFNDLDLVITIGGDGTFIKASSFIDATPIIGINSEPETSEGALTSIMESELDFLNEIMKGNFKTVQKTRIQVKRDNKLLKELALNEIFVGAKAQFDTARYVIRYNNKEEEQRSSGVLIATASGSTAWYKSANGIPFTNETDKVKFKVREPFFGRVFNPKILEGEIQKEEKLFFESKRIDGSIVAIDSMNTYDFNLGTKLEIEISDKPLNVIVK